MEKKEIYLEKRNTENKTIKTFAVDRKLYADFKKYVGEIGYSVSEVLGEFMKRVVELLESGEGGEVVFGIKPNKKEEDNKKKK